MVSTSKLWRFLLMPYITSTKELWRLFERGLVTNILVLGISNGF